MSAFDIIPPANISASWLTARGTRFHSVCRPERMYAYQVHAKRNGIIGRAYLDPNHYSDQIDMTIAAIERGLDERAEAKRSRPRVRRA